MDLQTTVYTDDAGAYDSRRVRTSQPSILKRGYYGT